MPEPVPPSSPDDRWAGLCTTFALKQAEPALSSCSISCWIIGRPPAEEGDPTSLPQPADLMRRP